METCYITTDLDLESQEDLSPLVAEIGKRALPSHDGWVNGKYLVVLAYPIDHETPEQTVEGFCDLIEGLSENSKKLWRSCSTRVLDIAFDSGETPTPYHCQLPEPLVNRISALGITIAISVYPVGFHNQEPPVGEA